MGHYAAVTTKPSNSFWPLAENRAKLYAFLSSAFGEELLSHKIIRFLSDVPLEDLTAAFPGEPAWKDALSQFQRRACIATGYPETFDLGVRIEFAHLFLLPEGVKPYESIYTGQEGLLREEPWAMVRRYYAACGLYPSPDLKLPDDHLAVELGFMSHLAYLSVFANDPGEQADLLKVQQDFLNQHLSQWGGQLLEDVVANQFSDLYVLLATVARILLQRDPMELEALLGDRSRI